MLPQHPGMHIRRISVPTEHAFSSCFCENALSRAQALRDAGEALLLTSDVDLSSRRRGAWNCIYAARPAAEFAMLSLVRCGESARVSVTFQAGQDEGQSEGRDQGQGRGRGRGQSVGAMCFYAVAAALSDMISAVCHLTQQEAGVVTAVCGALGTTAFTDVHRREVLISDFSARVTDAATHPAAQDR